MDMSDTVKKSYMGINTLKLWHVCRFHTMHATVSALVEARGRRPGAPFLPEVLVMVLPAVDEY